MKGDFRRYTFTWRKLAQKILAKKEMHAKFAIGTRNVYRFCDKKQGGSLEGTKLLGQNKNRIFLRIDII